MRGRGVSVIIMTVALAFVLVSPMFSAAPTNYAGAYSAQPAKGAATNTPSTTVRVTQDDQQIEITRVEGGKTAVSRFPLNGSEGDYTSPGGVADKGKAQFKGKDLVLESIVVTKPQPNGPNVRMRTKERWQLSSDSKVLKIRFDMDFPGLQGLTGGVTNQSWTETYVRSNTP